MLLFKEHFPTTGNFYKKYCSNGRHPEPHATRSKITFHFFTLSIICRRSSIFSPSVFFLTIRIRTFFIVNALVWMLIFTSPRLECSAVLSAFTIGLKWRRSQGCCRMQVLAIYFLACLIFLAFIGMEKHTSSRLEFRAIRSIMAKHYCNSWGITCR